MNKLQSLFSCAFIIAIINNSAMAQPSEEKIIVPDQIKQMISKGYDILNFVEGDLNLDNHSDAILVLYKKEEKQTSDVTSHPEKRPLLIFTGKKDKRYTLAKRSDNAVYCIDCGGAMGDPFTGITIKKGYFSVEHYGGSAAR